MIFKRTHTCGELRNSNIGDQVTLNGWVDGRRNFGSLLFIDLRDRYGVTQVVFDEADHELHEQADELRNEYVVGIKGKVLKRSDGNTNEDMETGDIEVEAEALKVYSEADTPPFEIKDDIATNEELRQEYRYLDLRRSKIQQKLLMRSRLTQTVRNYFHDHEFAEVETPFLMKSTPEGARDYLVPSRVNAGKFFALPQSPQTYKQLLMLSGFDRYFQIVKCFRDEDLRADRQPEFTQIDVEMSFVEEDDIIQTTEEMVQKIFKEMKDVDIELPFPRMSYQEALTTYGSDKPDTRFGLKIEDLSDIVADAEFRIFADTVEKGGAVIAINVPGEGAMGRGEVDRLTERVQRETGAAGLIYIKRNEKDGTKCSVGKFLEDETVEAMVERAGAGPEDLVLILAGPTPEVYEQMGALRLMVGEKFELIDHSKNDLRWVTDFPLMQWDADEQRYQSLHHPFTAPQEDEMDKLESNPDEVHSRAYDLVLNGYEIGGGSIRIHNEELQKKIFDLLKIDPDEAQERFGFLLDAFKYGAPPHGGIALGLDRIAMILSDAESLRDVIAFPKNKHAQNTMDGSPANVDQEQLDDLHIKLKKLD